MNARTFNIVCSIFSFVLLCGGLLPTSAQQRLLYSPVVTPTPYNFPRLYWKITNVTSESVEFGFGSKTYWQASVGDEIVFEIHALRSNDVHGLFTIGNLTLPVNDSRIAAEVVFSIWPWFPGFISSLDWSSVDQNATNAATGFMEGSLVIWTTTNTKTYIYHQGQWGNQNTTLVYDLKTGVLLEGYTEFFFINDYHLGVELVQISSIPTSLTYFVLVFASVIIGVIIILFYTRQRS